MGAKIDLNVYGELVENKESFQSPRKADPKPYAREICSICINSVPIIYHTCKGCNDNRAYCSDSCFEKHLRLEHYEGQFCAQCGSRIGQRYKYAKDIDRAKHKRVRFCSLYCLEQFRKKELCAECGTDLPQIYKYGNDVDRVKGRRVKFCSSYCLNQFRKKELCAECETDLPKTYTYGDDVDRAEGWRVRFCSGYCLNKYRKRHLCFECDRRLPETYTYCQRCGSNQLRFCGSACFDRHWKRSHT